jgi:hypothetical protein
LLWGARAGIGPEGIGYGLADGEADDDSDGDADSDSEGDADGDSEADAGTDGSDGSGMAVGSGTKRDGIPSAERRMIRTKIPRMASTHSRANRSSRVGSEPR